MNITWTKQDILYLRQSKDAVSYETMAKNLGKTVCAVKNKLIRMYSDKEYDGIKTMELSRILGVSKWYVRNYINKYGLKAKKVKRAGKVYSHIIMVQDFWKWAYDNFDLVKWENCDIDLLLPIPSWYEEKYKKYKNQVFNSYRKETWTKQQLAYLEFYRNQGKTFEEIAEIMGKSKIAVEKMYYKNFTNRKEIHIPWKLIEEELLLKMKSKGKTYKEISNELGRSEASCKRKYLRIIKQENVS